MRIAGRLVLLGLLLVPLAGCSQDGSFGDSDKLVVAVIPKSLGAQFWETVEKGARAAAKEMDVEMKWEGPVAETEIAEQNKIIQNMVNLDVDGIARQPQRVASLLPVSGIPPPRRTQSPGRRRWAPNRPA